MKKIVLLALLSLSGIPQVNMAMTIVADKVNQAELSPDLANNAVTTAFGVSGTINRYQADQSVIVIDDVSYVVDGMGSLTEADLITGQKIMFNIEKSASENHGHITKIWLNQE